jgi:serine/threonine protein kinase/TolB-like protein
MISKTISHYKIIEKLGGGGMGVVYKATDLKLNRPVALKFLPPELLRDPNAKKRFIREAQAASSLQHENTCVIHDIEDTDDGQLFICMEYYKGETLKKKIEQGPLQIEKAIDFASQITKGLARAHNSKMIHRDIKPANIMITDNDEVKIVDFGLAHLAGQSKITKDGSTLGTIDYMSPEQTVGKKVDYRTDIWAVGVVLYEMITGRLPFYGEYDQAIIYSILNDEPEKISELRSDVPAQLEDVVSKALSKSPNERYQKIEDCVVDLGRLKKDLERKHTFNRVARKIKDEQRKLAAIMFTDMVGYCAITQKNESLALELLEEHRQILRSHFPQHGGYEVETVGDSFFVEFTSALEAVQCAIEIQKALFERNKSVPEEKQIKIRIGVHLGDVVHSGKNVLGDGVNIASRIEPLARSCGICVSQDVARQIENKIDLPIKKIDRAKLKNIEIPVEVYAVVLPWLEKELKSKRAIRLKKKNVWLPATALLVVIFILIAIWLMPGSMTNEANKKSIAVMLCENRIDLEDKNRLGEIITDALITDLMESRYATVISLQQLYDILKQMGKEGHKVIAKSEQLEVAKKAGVTRILTSSIGQLGSQYILTAQCIDVQSGEVIDSKEFTDSKDNIHDMINSTSSHIRPILGLPEEVLGEQDRSFVVVTTSSTKAYRHYLAGEELAAKYDMIEAEKEYKKAVDLDSTFATAYSRLAAVYRFLRKKELASYAIEKAFDHINHLKERERYEIYYQRAIEV